ncbi:AHH domain-containing protein [Novosphingobium sp.]|uniref:AHH domain-containing protein n=1 Tax=Novosphingobium sp. TaxID=1874826 RepID=UPI002733FA6C|nr:AHH domain-containing protein [Novosphingobium sp.]MDP3907151.1 AHH domain-containing protein [Novosphingobium sp.]
MLAHTRQVGLRPQLSFRAVNRRDVPGYDPGLQRHHILPRQVLSCPSLVPMLSELGQDRIGFDDFRRNGLLLPANDFAAVRIGLPLHRGPHRTYNELVLERIGQIEAGWSAQRPRAPELALNDALMRLELLQRALRRRLLDQRRRMRLNTRDPLAQGALGQGVDFAELDAMAALLWPDTAGE